MHIPCDVLRVTYSVLQRGIADRSPKSEILIMVNNMQQARLGLKPQAKRANRSSVRNETKFLKYDRFALLALNAPG